TLVVWAKGPQHRIRTSRKPGIRPDLLLPLRRSGHRSDDGPAILRRQMAHGQHHHSHSLSRGQSTISKSIASPGKYTNPGTTKLLDASELYPGERPGLRPRKNFRFEKR